MPPTDSSCPSIVTWRLCARLTERAKAICWRVMCDNRPVFSVRCTKKLLDRMRVDPDLHPPAPTTILGDWYANLLYVGKQQFILCVSEKTLVPVIVPAVDAKHLPHRLPEAVFEGGTCYRPT